MNDDQTTAAGAATRLGDPAAYDHDGDVVGDLRVWRDVELAGLGRSADVLVHLPPGYDVAERTYPVVYMHDGQNLFDPRTSTGGVTWGVDRAMGHLAGRGIEAIVVAVPCSPTARGEEYTPYAHPVRGGGRADDYVRFLADHLKPAVDAVLRTRRGPEDTVVAGSSLGGVISVHAWLTRPDVFGGVGAFSPAFWWPGEPMLRDVEAALASPPPGRVHLDTGGREEPDEPDIERAYVDDAERLLGWLRRAGVPVHYVYDSVAPHFESAWAQRLPEALAWLLEGYAVQPPASG